MSIEREQPSTAFTSMPAYGMDNSSFKAQPIEDIDGFKKLGDIKGEFQADELTGEGLPNNIWGSRENNVSTNGSATSFEDRHIGDYDTNDVVTCNGIDADIQRPTHPNDLSGTSGLGGSTYTNGTSREGLYFMTETFEPAAGMDFAGSLNPVLELGGNSGPGGTSFMTGSMGSPTDNFVGNPYPSPIG